MLTCGSLLRLVMSHTFPLWHFFSLCQSAVGHSDSLCLCAYSCICQERNAFLWSIIKKWNLTRFISEFIPTFHPCVQVWGAETERVFFSSMWAFCIVFYSKRLWSPACQTSSIKLILQRQRLKTQQVKGREWERKGGKVGEECSLLQVLSWFPKACQRCRHAYRFKPTLFLDISELMQNNVKMSLSKLLCVCSEGGDMFSLFSHGVRVIQIAVVLFVRFGDNSLSLSLVSASNSMQRRWMGLLFLWGVFHTDNTWHCWLHLSFLKVGFCHESRCVFYVNVPHGFIQACEFCSRWYKDRNCTSTELQDSWELFFLLSCSGWMKM